MKNDSSFVRLRKPCLPFQKWVEIGLGHEWTENYVCKLWNELYLIISESRLHPKDNMFDLKFSNPNRQKVEIKRFVQAPEMCLSKDLYWTGVEYVRLGWI